MSEKIPQFNFSKIEEQKKFEKLPEKEREKFIDEARAEAEEKPPKELEKNVDDKIKDGLEDEKIVEEKGKEKEIVLTEEQNEALEELKKWLVDGVEYIDDECLDNASRIIKKNNLPDQVTEEYVNQAIQNIIVNCHYYEGGSLNDALKAKSRFSLDKERFEEIIRNSALELIDIIGKDGGFDVLSSILSDLVEIKDKFQLTDSYLKDSEIQNLMKSRLCEFVKDVIFCPDECREFFQILNKSDFPVPSEPMVDVLSYWMEYMPPNYADLEDSADIVQSISDPKIYILEKKFKISSKIVSEAVKKVIFHYIHDIEGIADIDSILYMKNEYSVNITNEEIEEIIEKIPEINNLLSELQKVSPEFYNQSLKSFDVLMSLFEFKDKPERFLETVKENPFLLGAVSENPKFGSKLLIKYPQLDGLSQVNIELLFNTKKEILESNPEISPESLEFRQAMQKKLAEYESNPEIRDAIKEMGIDFDTWLNYSDTQYFSLESGKSEVAFSETIATPIKRIKETIDSYAYTIKSVLKEYRKELSEFQVPVEDPKDIEEKIAKMREAMNIAKDERNEKKAQGIAKGIEGLNAKLEKLKTVSLWNKLLGDIASFQQLKNGLFGAQENLIKIENEFQQSVSGKSLSGREIQKLKQRMAEGKEQLRVKFSALERRTEEFNANFPALLTSALGEDRTVSLTQEIEEKMAEQFDHYNSSRNTLANIFSEKIDKEKEKMDSQPMSIFVWARNPDTDLYQGNYQSNCCIRIDSKHMGAESTIADYNTDLGIQIVNIWDETKNEPVTAAWCWLGKDEAGRSALVVDNIESNELYSTSYPEQLKDELFEYLKKYAKTIGAQKLVLGKANNDLPTSGELNKMKNDASKYEYDKIGGYNRANGYFLEAQIHGTKLIWESKEKKKIEEKKEKAEKIKFQNIKTKSMTESDFSSLLNIERKVYTREDLDLIQGQEIIEDLKKGNGLEYSIALSGKRKGQDETEMIGYVVAIDDETDEGEPSVYLEDIAVLPETQGQGVGWKMMKEFVIKLKAKAKSQEKPVLLDMHLRENSQAFMEKHKEDLEKLGVKLVEEALVADYYDDGEDALYQIYEVK